MKKNYKPIEDYFNQDSDALHLLRSSGKSRLIEDFPHLETYLKDSDGLYPRVVRYDNAVFSHKNLMNSLEIFSPKTIFSSECVEIENGKTLRQNTYIRLSKGYFLEVVSNFEAPDAFDSMSLEKLQLDCNTESGHILMSFVALHCPPKDSSLYSEELEDGFLNIVRINIVKKNFTTPSIGMLCQEDGDFYIKDFYIKSDYKLVEPDLHYGKGFSDFHKSLLERFKDETKGLILFHGTPGTGKTYYIRCLMKDLLQLDKFIIYLPPNMMDFMISPEMISFISQLIMEKNSQHKHCIILLEDAEPLIESRRNTGGRSDGITNLLNMTDGLLNDMLNVQVIATFNTDLKNIDEALLRPERLIARKEFKKLSKEDSISLAAFLKSKKKIEGECTLAEIYSSHKHREILTHEYNDNKKKLGF